MPHLPRQTPPGRGPRQELLPPSPEAQARPAEEAGARGTRIGVKKMSLNDVPAPAPDEVCKLLFGKEPVRDPHTGELVLAPGPGRPPQGG